MNMENGQTNAFARLTLSPLMQMDRLGFVERRDLSSSRKSMPLPSTCSLNQAKASSISCSASVRNLTFTNACIYSLTLRKTQCEGGQLCKLPIFCVPRWPKRDLFHRRVYRGQ